MKHRVRGYIIVLLVFITLLFSFTPLVFGSGVDSPQKTTVLATIGTPGVDAIGLRISIGDSPYKVFKAGEPVTISVEVNRKAYLVALNESRRGNVTVLIPNKFFPDDPVIPGKKKILFSGSSPIRLIVDEQIKGAKILLFVSSKPVDLAPLRIPENQPVITIPHSSIDRINILSSKLKEMSKDNGFNRIVVTINSVGKAGVVLRRMGNPKGPVSTKPIDLLGSQGVKTKLKDMNNR